MDGSASSSSHQPGGAGGDLSAPAWRRDAGPDQRSESGLNSAMGFGMMSGVNGIGGPSGMSGMGDGFPTDEMGNAVGYGGMRPGVLKQGAGIEQPLYRPPSDAEISAILSSYQNMGAHDADSVRHAALAAAAAASATAAPYGSMGSFPPAPFAGSGMSLTPAQQALAQGQMYQHQLQSAGLQNQHQQQQRQQQQGNAGAGPGYEGDASNTSSSQTPGGTSSGDDSSGSKQRRQTFGGLPTGADGPASEVVFGVGFDTDPRGGADAAAANNALPNLRPGQPQAHFSLLQHQQLMHQEQQIPPHQALHMQSPQNAYGTDQNMDQGPSTGTSAQRPRSLSGPGASRLLANRPNASSAVPIFAPGAAQPVPAAWLDGKRPSLGQAGPAGDPVVGAGGPSSNMSLPPSMLGGHAASHPPGLGSQVLRGLDGSTSTNAASDFTKRKGWSNRIVEELLDFVHVLDDRGRILFASPSVSGLTGWKAEELRGRNIAEFIHPDDVAHVQRDFDRALAERSDLLLYYRFRRKPMTAVEKKAKRHQRAHATSQQANLRSRSESSGSTNGDDSSQAQSMSVGIGKSVVGGGAGGGLGGAAPLSGKAREREEKNDDGDDLEAKWVVFEATGHPYSPPPEIAAGVLGAGKKDDEEEADEDAVDEDEEESADDDKDGDDDDDDDDGYKNGKAKRRRRGTRSSSRGQTKAELSSGGTAGGKAKPETDASAEEVKAKLRCFFCSCRIYPTKNVSMLDSFLELKLENERLRLMLADLDVNDPSLPAELTGAAPGGARRSLDEAAFHPDFYHAQLEEATRRESFPPGSTPSSAALVHTQSQQSASGSRNDGLGGLGGTPQHARSVGGGQALERVPTGGTNGGGGDESDPESPTTTSKSGGAGAAHEVGGGGGGGGSASANEEAKRQRKKNKLGEGDFVCTDCGRVDSPEWRKGPLGPKTLCNACGLRWAKKVKRSGGDPNAIAMAAAKANKANAAAAAAAVSGGPGPAGPTGGDAGGGLPQPVGPMTGGGGMMYPAGPMPGHPGNAPPAVPHPYPGMNALGAPPHVPLGHEGNQQGMQAPPGGQGPMGPNYDYTRQ